MSNVRMCDADDGNGTDTADWVHTYPTSQLSSTTRVLILDNDHPGVFGFDAKKRDVFKDDPFCVRVRRTRGARGRVLLPYSAMVIDRLEEHPPVDGVLQFDDDQTEAVIRQLIIVNDAGKHANNQEMRFEIVLGTPICGSDEAAPETEQQKVIVHPVLDAIHKCTVRLKSIPRPRPEKHSIKTTSSWREQFEEAIHYDNKDGISENECPNFVNKIIYALTLPWKLLFALVPPTELLRGWACFVVSMGCIILLTTLIIDLSKHFGCTVELKDSVTALSLVAAGTCIADTFASRLEAQEDENADNSIGHVTVWDSVFLGIGIPWTLATIYHEINGTVFHVHPGALGFSVFVFILTAMFATCILQVRRHTSIFGKAELGGPLITKLLTVIVFILLWIAYVSISALEAYCMIPNLLPD